jgi:hypothetical protein
MEGPACVYGTIFKDEAGFVLPGTCINCPVPVPSELVQPFAIFNHVAMPLVACVLDRYLQPNFQQRNFYV